MALQSLLEHWKQDKTVAENIVTWEHIPARAAQFAPLPEEIDVQMRTALEKRGIRQLYSHQAEAWNEVNRGKHVVIATGTASGKTLGYNLPVIQTLLQQPQARAMYLYPTKALAQDQYDEILSLLGGMQGMETPIGPGVYDGDTSTGTRATIRSRARLVISNPDMLHTGILPHHTGWANFLRGLKFVVVDEMHTYRGVFGSHVANVIRRLKRICRFYGAFPQFIMTSATIANPAELAGKLIEEPVQVIDRDGAMRGEKNFLIYNPPIVNPELGIRASLLKESVRIASDLHKFQIQTVVFGRTRRSIEKALIYLREEANQSSPGSKNSEQIRGYRSGYLPNQRREIEQGLRQGEVRLVVATNALELGIDIGQLEASVMAGYPGTIASTWQQAGRAGRGEETSLAILVVSANPLDQYLARYPEYFFRRSPEQALINPDNLLILLGHLRCAAFELPFQTGDHFGNINPEALADLLSFLQEEQVLHRSGERYFWMADAYPAQAISLRSASPDAILLHTSESTIESERSRLIGKVDLASSYWMIHPGAIYLHEGQTFLVETLDLEHQTATLTPFNGDYYTDPQRAETVQVLETVLKSEAPGCQIAHGEVLVTSQVVGYKKIRWFTQENIGYADLEMPTSELHTSGYWIMLTEETVHSLQEQGLWTNAPNDYGPQWNKLRELVRQRDGYRCQMCGTLENERAHDVHHKTPFRSFTSAEQANQLSNLVTLCHTCHHKAETAVRMRSGLAGLVFTLGNLAPLFLMCDPGDLGMHSDPQAQFDPLAEKPTPGIVIFDLIPAGIGLSQRLFEIHENLIQHAWELVRTCPCLDGCPSCVGPGGENGYGGKVETLALLEALRGDSAQLSSAN
jgi:DEAD/DEAH box helicase domain-containing protein